MKKHIRILGQYAAPTALAVVVLLGTGCPVGTPVPSDYDVGFEDGFGMDQKYWDGYFDGWFTIDGGDIFYAGHLIPEIQTPEYNAGFYDGNWYAYNDGYFTDYRYAFVIGFSEGYDNAFWDDYLDFLINDFHVEWLDGGWSDGYNDGYSEGRIFGANDFEQGLPFDWLDALIDYESGTDIYFEEVPIGTGEFGNVIIYEYGTDPNTLIKANRKAMNRAVPSIRKTDAEKQVEIDASEFRPIIPEVAADLSINPLFAYREDVELGFTTTWLERIDLYLSTLKTSEGPLRNRRVVK